MKQNKFIYLLLISFQLFAQQPTTANLTSINKNGLHKIFLPAEITAFSKKDLADLRIFDSKGAEVPYRISQAENTTTKFRFVPFHIVSKTSVPKVSTSIVVENPNEKISELTLYIANAVVTKKFSISGSNDRKDWYGLVNNSELSDIKNEQSTSGYKTIQFPLTSYKYLRIDLNDKKTLPLNVLLAGYFEGKTNSDERIEILKPRIFSVTEQKDKKQTLIQVKFSNQQEISSVGFVVSAPNLYKRQARFYNNVSYKVRRKTQTRQENLAVFELASDKNNSFQTNGLSAKEFFIAIENRDNPPLKFSKIEFRHSMPCLIADLKSNESYTLKTGDGKLLAPDYDIADITIADSLFEVKVSEIKHSNRATVSENSKSIWQKPWFMWVCIAIGGAAIAYFATSLAKDIK